MRYLGTKKVVCPACGVELDVPLYHVDGINHYGMKFCHQCGAPLGDGTESSVPEGPVGKKKKRCQIRKNQAITNDKTDK